jgi:Protein of unknown function (DUF520)
VSIWAPSGHVHRCRCEPDDLILSPYKRGCPEQTLTETGKKLQKLIKESKLKVQAAIQGDKLRITGKQRDDLQDAIATMRKAEGGCAVAVQ